MLSNTPDWVADPVPSYWICRRGVGWLLFSIFPWCFFSDFTFLPSRTLFLTQTHTHARTAVVWTKGPSLGGMVVVWWEGYL